ncbi:MAG: glycosyltransferase family 39 protein, partial [Anaerolineae bacterium]|nr:glycosyltransferase family 39 protein [Anaerolineae bacterium]
MRTLRYHQIIVLVLVIFSVLMSALVSRTVFERMPHLEDEVAYLFQAKTYAGGHLTVDTPAPRRAYWQPFVITDSDTGLRFSKYSPGWPIFLAIGVLLGQPWIVNALLAGVTVALVYRLGREIFDPDVGVLAAALTSFSPMALLLNGTLMGHTAALCMVTLFMYAFWRIEQGKQALRWGIAAGIALGLVVINRPLTAIGITGPFVIWSFIRLGVDLWRRRDLAGTDYKGFWLLLRPYLALGILTLLISTAIPIYNYAATGNPRENLYTLVWSYDQVGFGDCCGRSGHTLEKGLRHVRFDLSL